MDKFIKIIVAAEQDQVVGHTRRTWTRGMLGSAALMLVLFSSSAANAQCTTSPGGNTRSQYTAAVAFLGFLNTANTAFLTQSNAFVAGQSSSKPDQLGGGLWIRGVAGESVFDNVGTVTRDTGPFTCHSQIRLGYQGFQVGADLARLNMGGSGGSINIGVTGGVLQGQVNERTGLTTGPGTVSFGGVYATYIKGGFFADMLARWDFYRLAATQTDLGIIDQKVGGDGFSISGSIGYNQPIGTWFVEPSASLIWANLRLDQLPNAGNPAAGTGSGVLLVDTIQSRLGRAGARVGTTFAAGNVNLQPFIGASVWHEFASDSTGTILSSGNHPFQTVSVSRVGTYGQYSGGLAVQVPNSGLLGYARFDYRKGDNIEGWGVNIGLRSPFAPR